VKKKKELRKVEVEGSEKEVMKILTRFSVGAPHDNDDKSVKTQKKS
jgi:hypothetical protein